MAFLAGSSRHLRLYRRLLTPPFRKYVAAQRKRNPRATKGHLDRETALVEAIAWLYRSQDAGPERCSRCFRVATGWSACYPEVTGYNLDTLFDHSRLTGAEESFRRAVAMAEWELTVQLESGAFQGAACRAADWLVSVQDPDGAWRRHCFLGEFRVTEYTRRLPLVAGLEGDRHRGLPYCRREEPSPCDVAATGERMVPGVRQLGRAARTAEHPHPGLHDRGLLEAGYLLQDKRVIAAGRRTADAMLRRFEIDRVLHRRYNRRWRATVRWSCLTGCAQSSENWLGLYRHTGSPWYLNAALKMNDYLVACQDVTSGHPGVRGAMAGSEPFGGGYQGYAFPSWATKYFCDALISEREALGKMSVASGARREDASW